VPAQNKLSIVIPVFNEASTVLTLLNRVWDQEISIPKEMVIVESNSRDRTRDIVVRFAQEKNDRQPGSVTVILQESAKGKGNAVRTGLLKVTGDIVMIQDGDLEYDTKDYGALISPILEGKSSFVLGSRHLAAGSWKIREFGKNQIRSRIMNFGGMFFHGFFNILYGQRLTDPTTMYKVFKRSCLKDFDLVANRFDFDFELVAKLLRAGYPAIEVPVSYTSRGFEDGKKIRVFRDPITWIWAILKFRLQPLKKKG
jgi:glycosyltransferase involved in cell wall biosynthesis